MDRLGFELQAGMTAKLAIVTEERRACEYLISPFLESLGRAFREQKRNRSQPSDTRPTIDLINRNIILLTFYWISETIFRTPSNELTPECVALCISGGGHRLEQITIAGHRAKTAL